MSEARKHHDYSPSSLQCREASACYKPNDNETEASRLGNKQHKAYETGDLSKLTDEQAAAVEICINYSDEIRDEMTKKYGAPPEQINEAYLKVDDEESTAGYIDRAYVSPCHTYAELLDCKFGKWAVEPAETNVQGICYTLGLRQKFFPKLKKVRVSFMLPYLGYIDSHTFDLEETFEKLLLRVRAIVARAKAWQAAYEAKRATWHPTTGTCLFCGRLGECEAIPGVALKISDKFAPLALPANYTPSISGDAKDAEIRMKLSQLMVTWGQATRRQITAAVIDDRCEVPEGYEMIESQRRDTKDSAKVIDIAREEFGLSQEQIDQASSISLTKLEDAVSDNAPRRGKTEAVETFRNRLKTADALKEGKPYAYLRMIRPDGTGDDDLDNNTK